MSDAGAYFDFPFLHEESELHAQGQPKRRAESSNAQAAKRIKPNAPEVPPPPGMGPPGQPISPEDTAFPSAPIYPVPSVSAQQGESDDEFDALMADIAADSERDTRQGSTFIKRKFGSRFRTKLDPADSSDPTSFPFEFRSFNKYLFLPSQERANYEVNFDKKKQKKHNGEEYGRVSIHFGPINLYHAVATHKATKKRTYVRSGFPTRAMLIGSLTNSGFDTSSTREHRVALFKKVKEVYRGIYGDDTKIWGLEKKPLEDEMSLVIGGVSNATGERRSTRRAKATSHFTFDRDCSVDDDVDYDADNEGSIPDNNDGPRVGGLEEDSDDEEDPADLEFIVHDEVPLQYDSDPDPRDPPTLPEIEIESGSESDSDSDSDSDCGELCSDED